MGDYEWSIEVSIQGRQQDRSLVGALLNLAARNAFLGNTAETRRYVTELLEIVPRFTLRALAKNPMFIKSEHIDKLVDGMRLAGLPE